jgi:microcompartment protein CcmK/EutM
VKVMDVVGKLSLSRVHPTLTGKRWVLAVPVSLVEMVGETRDGERPEELTIIDELGATPGARIGVSEGGEALFPFLPDEKPVDAYLSCILDEITLDRDEVNKLLKRPS